MHTRELGGLTCRMVGNSESPDVIAVFCHGYGANGDDLVPLGTAICQMNPGLDRQVLFVFPEAPLRVSEVPGGRAWWPIDLDALQRAAITGELRDMRQLAPPELPSARSHLMDLIHTLQEQTRLPLSRFVLGGFSQGAMLATDVALRLPENIGSLIVYSGTLLTEPEWKALAPQHAGLQVFQSHGTMDPLLPFEAATWLRDLLGEAGADVEFLPFAGLHTIPAQGVQAAAAQIARLLPEATSPNQ